MPRGGDGYAGGSHAVFIRQRLRPVTLQSPVPAEGSHCPLLKRKPAITHSQPQGRARPCHLGPADQAQQVGIPRPCPRSTHTGFSSSAHALGPGGSNRERVVTKWQEPEDFLSVWVSMENSEVIARRVPEILSTFRLSHVHVGHLDCHRHLWFGATGAEVRVRPACHRYEAHRVCFPRKQRGT